MNKAISEKFTHILEYHYRKHTPNVGVWIISVSTWWSNEKHPPQKLMGLLSMLGTTEKQGLALRQGSLSKYSTLTWPSLKDALHLKDQFVCSLGDRWHITGTRRCAPCQLAVWVSSRGPPLSGLHARPPELFKLLPQLCVPAVLVHLSCCLLPSPLLTTSFLLLPGRRRPIYQRDDLSTGFGELIL